ERPDRYADGNREAGIPRQRTRFDQHGTFADARNAGPPDRRTGSRAKSYARTSRPFEITRTSQDTPFASGRRCSPHAIQSLRLDPGTRSGPAFLDGTAHDWRLPCKPNDKGLPTLSLAGFHGVAAPASYAT